MLQTFLLIIYTNCTFANNFHTFPCVKRSLYFINSPTPSRLFPFVPRILVIHVVHQISPRVGFRLQLLVVSIDLSVALLFLLILVELRRLVRSNVPALRFQALLVTFFVIERESLSVRRYIINVLVNCIRETILAWIFLLQMIVVQKTLRKIRVLVAIVDREIIVPVTLVVALWPLLFIRPVLVMILVVQFGFHAFFIAVIVMMAVIPGTPVGVELLFRMGSRLLWRGHVKVKENRSCVEVMIDHVRYQNLHVDAGNRERHGVLRGVKTRVQLLSVAISPRQRKRRTMATEI